LTLWKVHVGSLLGDAIEPDFDLVQPGSISRGEVNMKAWSQRQPAFDPRVLVRRVVVDDDVDIQILRNVLLDFGGGNPGTPDADGRVGSDSAPSR